MLQKLLIPGVLSAVIAFIALAVLAPSSETTKTYADTSIDSEEQTFINLLNQYRVDHNLVPLLIDPSLQNAAEWINPYERFWRTRLDALETHLRRRHGRHHP